MGGGNERREKEIDEWEERGKRLREERDQELEREILSWNHPQEDDILFVL